MALPMVAGCRQLVFVSGRTGKGDAYLLDPATRACSR